MYHLRPQYQEDPCDCLDGPQRPITTESGDVVCTGCGRVLEAHIFDERPDVNRIDPLNDNVSTR